MGYLYAAGAVLAGLTKGYCGKMTGGTIKGLRATLMFNALRMCLCVPIGLLFAIRSASPLAVSPKELLIFAVSGVSTALFVMSWIICIRQGAYMMVDTFVTLGVAVPVVLCRVIYGEAIKPTQTVGMVLLLAAEGGVVRVSFLILPIELIVSVFLGFIISLLVVLARLVRR